MRATFPHLAMAQGAQFHLVGQSVEGSESISGAETVIPTMRGRWMAQVGFALHGEAATLQWQAFLAQMQGRVGTTLVPVHSRYRANDERGLSLPSCKTTNFASAQTFEHFGFDWSEVNHITMAEDASLRDTEITVNYPDSTGLRPGHFFSIGERLHRVQHYWRPSSGVHQMMIEPPLREAVSAGAKVEVARPVCKMRMTTETEGLFDHSLDRLPRVSVNFVEAL